MTVQTPDTKDEQDSVYNPGEIHASEQFGNYVSSGVDQAESFANDSANTTDDLEKNPSFTSNVTGNKQTASKVSFVKKKGPMGLIIGLLVGGGGLAGFLLTPALMPIALVETLTNDLNDSSSWYNQKSHVLFGKKLGKLQSKVGYCGSVVTIRCKFSTLSKTAALDFKNAGIELLPESDPSKTGGRVAFESMRFTNINGSDGKPVTVSTPAQLNKVLRENVNARSTLYAAFNPSNGSFFGNRFKNLLAKWGTSKAKKIQGATAKEVNESYTSATSTDGGVNENIATQASDVEEIEGDSDDEKNNKEETKKLSGEIGEKIGEGKRVSAADLKKPTGALAPAQLGCAAYSVGNIVSTGAKTVKAARLIKFTMIFFTLASTMKAGEATDAEVDKGMDILAPSSYPTEIEDPETGKMVKNPNINKNALDSEGFKLSAHGDQGELSSFAGKYLVAGGATGILQNTINTMNEKVPGGRKAIKTGCKVVNNKIVNIVATVAGGLGSIAMYALTEAFSKQIGDIMAAIINKAIDATAGADLTTNIKGVDAGNAIFAGAGAMLGASAGSVGMKPGSKTEIIENMAANQQTNESYIAVEKFNAKDEPFNVANRYSMLGSMAYSLQSATASGSVLSKITGIIPLAINGMVPVSSAATMTTTGYTQDTDRFSQCTDSAYKDLGIDADKFCNVRYVPLENRDIDEVTDYMLKGDIDETGNATSDDYKNYLQFCVNRTDGWGEAGDTSADDDWAIGKRCLEDTNQNIMFANYVAYVGVQDDMENDLTYTSTPGINIGTYNIRSSNITGDVTTRSRLAADNIRNSSMDIVGLQEAESDQVDKIQGNLSDSYDHATEATRTIFWNKSKFSLSKSGSFDIPKKSLSSGQNSMLWVKLRIVDSSGSGGKEFYVIDIHPDVDSEANRTTAAEKVLSLMKDEMNDGLPIIIVGDMNSGDEFATNSGGRATGKQINEVFMKSKLLTYTYEVAEEKKNADFKSYNGFEELESVRESKAVHIDQIYISSASNATVNSWENVINDTTSEASDHNPIVVNLSIPGISTSPADSSGGISANGDAAWVLGEDNYKKYKSDFLGSHYTGGGFLGDGSHSNDISWSGIEGEKTYAIFGGTVTKQPLGRSSRRCTGSPNVNNNGGLQIESKVDGGTVITSYAHGNAVQAKKGDTVETGAYIMEIGSVGNSCGPHLHIDMTYNGDNVCTQDLFRMMESGSAVNFKELVVKAKGRPQCG